jgi:hypothetical protein
LTKATATKEDAMKANTTNPVQNPAQDQALTVYTEIAYASIIRSILLNPEKHTEKERDALEDFTPTPLGIRAHNGWRVFSVLTNGDVVFVRDYPRGAPVETKPKEEEAPVAVPDMSFQRRRI